jgi:argininosuccinate synthase
VDPVGFSSELDSANRKSTDDPVKAPSTPQEITLHFEKGIPVKLVADGKETTGSLEIFVALNALGKLHGIGRIDIVEVSILFNTLTLLTD